MPTLPLSDIIQLTVNVSPTGAVASGFNLGLVVGTSTVIAGTTNDRVRLYTSLSGIVADGFSTNSAEYLAASLYFSQSPQPARLAVGRWNSATETALSAVIACRAANTDFYAFTVCGASDLDKVSLAGWAESAQPAVAYMYTAASAASLAGTAGTAQVETATVAGTVTLAGTATFTVTAAGMIGSPKAISVAVALNDTASQVAAKAIAVLAADPSVAAMFKAGGTGANVTLTALMPVANDATLNIAIANGTCTGLTAAPTSVHTTAGVAGSTLLAMKGLSYTHTLGQYSTQAADAVAAIMGYAMGANTGVASSAYTLFGKGEVGVAVEALTETQLTTIKAGNGNAYVSRGTVYSLFEQGVMASGMHFDTRLGLDMLSNALTIAAMNLITGTAKVPQDEGGMALLFNAIQGALRTSAVSGFLGPGTWTAAPVLSLNTGDYLSNGYVVLAGTFAAQSPADRAARKSPPIYGCIKLAGAVENVVLTVNVNQ